jgi:hypothetical protein
MVTLFLVIFGILAVVFASIRISRKYRWLHHNQWHVKEWLRGHLRKKRNWRIREIFNKLKIKI